MNKLLVAGMVACMVAATSLATAQTVDVTYAWARATVPGQKSSGAFMTLTSKEATKLVAIRTPVAESAQIHAMKMEGDVMTMRPVTGGLDLPAGKPVTLSSGGYHVMLMNLKAALPKESSIPMTLVFKNTKGVETTQELRVPVSLKPPAGTPVQDMAMTRMGSDGQGVHHHGN